MSLYGLVFGKNPSSDDILAALGNPDVGRFRDAWVEKAEDGSLRIAVYTRNGGGNREHWDFTYPDATEGETCGCPGCIIQYHLPKHPLYLFDQDDDFDCTYATIYFRLPDGAESLADDALDEPLNTDDRWTSAIDAIGKS